MNFELLSQLSASQALDDGAGSQLLTSNLYHQGVY